VSPRTWTASVASTRPFIWLKHLGWCGKLWTLNISAPEQKFKILVHKTLVKELLYIQCTNWTPYENTKLCKLSRGNDLVYLMLMNNQRLKRSPTINILSCLWSLQITLTLTEIDFCNPRLNNILVLSVDWPHIMYS